ncbi:MAG: cob(I)yrinic acid a,c-diamide adenosyltransferase [Clostridiaceae bacterium]|nr:cob(I)yrinic acid a,c-diamide adenosyltransferase [Clostridiaceae bacterium]
MDRKGMIHLYIGNGKGKTTAAIGMAIRALGWNMNVLFAQFLKTTSTGERNILDNFPEKLLFFRLIQRHSKFLWNMTEKELSETKEDILRGWRKIRTEIFSGNYDIVILDEILDCIQCDLLDLREVLKDISERPAKVEIVCTGRDAPKDFYEAADYITKMGSLKHPYDRGIKARCGIEY